MNYDMSQKLNGNILVKISVAPIKEMREITYIDLVMYDVDVRMLYFGEWNLSMQDKLKARRP